MMMPFQRRVELSGERVLLCLEVMAKDLLAIILKVGMFEFNVR